MKEKRSRIFALILCVLTLLTLIPTGAFAAGNTVTIESERNDAFDYLEYYKDGSWHDLNTPKHVIEQTGEICYCVEHSETNPHGDTYTATAPSAVFGANTLAGLQTILMYGYPCNTPSGFTADQARQATACAIRFWLSENGEPGSYNFTNRKANPTYIRAKSGYQHVLTWADELLQMARDRKTLTHSITFAPSSVTLTKSGSTFSGQTTVQLTNINSGYTLDTSALPSGVSITGFTGTKNDTLTITAPMSASGKQFAISATGKDTRSLENITAYVPANGSLQKIFLCATTAKVVASANISLSAPSYGYLKVIKTGSSNEPLPGVKFGVYSDSACTKKLCDLITGSDGIASSEELGVGTVYLKETSTIKPYVLEGSVRSIKIELNKTTSVTMKNTEAKGKITVKKMAEQLTGTRKQETEYGNVFTPVFESVGLKGCVYEVKNSSGKVVATVTTNADGYAETGELALGTYTVQEKSTVAGYILDKTVHTVKLEYKDQKTAVVTASVSAKNEPVPTAVKVKKMTESFNKKTMKFEPCTGEGFVFGVYSAEDIGKLPKDTCVEILTTDAKGEASTSVKLPFGKYYLRELAVPDDTIYLSEESLPLTLNGVNTVYFDKPVVNDMFKGSIAVWKSDSTNPDRMLEGAVYEIRDEDGLLYCTMTTDKTGYAVSIELPVGVYHLREIDPPTGFILSDEVTEITLTTKNKSTVVTEKDNKPNEMTLKKTDFTDGKPVPGAVITIFDEDGEVYYEGKTDENGEILITELPAGKYTFKETTSPDGYAINTETFSFEMDKYGKVTGDTELTDEPVTLIVNKIDRYTDGPFEGVEFKLINSDGEPVRTTLTDGGYRVASDEGEESFKSDAEGKIEIRYLKAGKYRLVESTPIGYISEDEWDVTLTNTDSLSNPFKISIKNSPTGLKILKIDSATGNPLTDAGFRIKVKGDLGFETLTFRKESNGSYFYDAKGSVMDMLTNGNGEIVIYGLPLGTVWIEESITPKGYFPISAQKAEITKEHSFINPLIMTIKNSKFVKLGLDSDWWEFPALITGIGLGIGALVLVLVKRAKRTKQEA